jgi:hypothetical protein
MSARKPSIPLVMTQDRAMDMAFLALKENIEIITGARPNIGKIQKLPSDATLAQTIDKLNEVISRLNFDGN